jgi:hypothetical protein
MADLIDEVRAGLVCERCGRYIGSLGPRRYRPAPYPIALGPLGPDAEAEALVGFERYMLGLLRRGAFTLRHPERDGRCVSLREWVEAADDDEDGDVERDG